MGGGGFGGGADFSDIFGDVFGDIFGGGRRQRASRGSDLRYNMELTSRKRYVASPKRSASRLWKSATSATAAAPSRAARR